jgi:hypothetical protein
MYRIAIFISLAVVACGPAAAMVDPPDEDEAPAVEQVSPRKADVASDKGNGGGSEKINGNGKGSNGNVKVSVPVCAPYAEAPSDAVACGASNVCDADADCEIYHGTYCDVGACAFDGCLRGRCSLTKVQGAACTRDGECVSGSCVCETDESSCVCAPQHGEPGFYGP